MTDLTLENITLQRVRKARATLMLSEPFFGVLSSNLEIDITARCQTAAIDGKRISFNPDYVKTLNDGELAGVFAHEIGHVVTEQLFRMHGREHDLYNRACDYVVNPMVRDAKFALPAGALFRKDLEKLTADAAYGVLKAERDAQQPPEAGEDAGQPDSGQSDAPDSPEGAPASPGEGESEAPTPDIGGCGSMVEPATGKAETDAALAEWRGKIEEAAFAARSMGKLSAGVARLLGDMKAGRMPWREMLREFMLSRVPRDYAMPPSRKYAIQGLLLPRLRSEALGTVVTVVDSSGSVLQPMLDDAAAEINELIGETAPERVVVIYVDSAVCGVEEFTRDDWPVKLTTKGGGGTSFKPAFDYLDAEGIEPDCLIYLTDLIGHEFAPEPAFPVMWISTTRVSELAGWGVKVPYGEVIEYA